MQFSIFISETADRDSPSVPFSLISTQWVFLWLLVIIFPDRMASYPQRSLPVEQAPQQSENLKFSHRFHLLRTTAACEDCHAVARNSTLATDNTLPSERDCLKCHDGRQAHNECTVCHKNGKTARPLKVPARTFRFNHLRHLELGNLAPVIAAAIDSGQYLSQAKNIRGQLDQENPCLACHRGLEEVDLASDVNLPQMADCLVCHAEIDPPFSCQFCHTQDAKIKPASHTPDYLDLHNSGRVKLQKPSCVICHGSHFRCMGCH